MNPTTSSQVVTNQAFSGATPTPTTPTTAGEIEFFVSRTEGERAKLDAFGAGFDTASMDGDGDGNRAAAADVNENAAGGCCSKLSPTLLSVKYPVLFAILNAAIYYADFGTDLNLAVKANRECNVTDVTMEDPPAAPPTVLPYIIIVVIVLHPIVMSAADLLAKGGMGWFGVLLNLTNTRMLYALYKAVAGGSQKNAVAAAKSANDVKLFEAVLESMPQLHLQFIYLLYYPDCVGGERDLIVSLAISTLSIVFALATKFEQLFDKAGKAWFMLAAWLYFASDAVSRGLAVAMVFGALGGGGVAAFAGGWVVLDLVWQVARKGDGGSASLPSTLLSLFTAMPLSTKKRDRTRLFLISTCLTLAMALCGARLGYPAMAPAMLAPHANDDDGSRTVEVVAAEVSGEAAGSDFEDAAPKAADATVVAVFAALAVKSLAYLFALRGGALEKGQAAQEAAGFSALFALSDVAGDQMNSWTGNDWAAFVKDPENANLNLRGKSETWGSFTAAVVKNMATGFKMAGTDCKVVDLKYVGDCFALVELSFPLAYCIILWVTILQKNCVFF